MQDQINKGKASSDFASVCLEPGSGLALVLGSIEAGRRPQEIGGEAQMSDSIAETLACF